MSDVDITTYETMMMTQEERWKNRYDEVVGFIETYHRNPSRHRIEEHDMLNWVKANRKAMNAGKMKAERAEKFGKLLELTEHYKRKNQWECEWPRSYRSIRNKQNREWKHPFCHAREAQGGAGVWVKKETSMGSMFKNIDEELYDGILWILSNSSEDYQKKYDDDYRKVLSACLKEYMSLVKEVTIDIFFYAKVVSNCDYMNRIVKSYLQGRHSTAFTQLKNILKNNADLYTTEVQVGELFYRMRSFDKRKGLSRKDLFHIPISKKRIIKTQRYSAPGYPCLYLGKSIYGCWEEMHRPNTETTLISCFKSQENLRVLDLRVPTLDEFFKETERYLQLFPFIIACGIPVRNAEDVYKPEYIVPQLILEWIIDNRIGKTDGLDGVYYTSANRNKDFYLLDHEWDNLGIPVQDSLSDEEFCPKLKSLFKCTKPTCYEYEHIQGNINVTGYWDDGPRRNDPEGLKNDYYMSLFSRLEELIERMTFYEVDTEEMD